MSGRDLPGVDRRLVERIEDRGDAEPALLAQVLADPLGGDGVGSLDSRHRSAVSGEVHVELDHRQQRGVVNYGFSRRGHRRVERLRLDGVLLVLTQDAISQGTEGLQDPDRLRRGWP